MTAMGALGSNLRRVNHRRCNLYEAVDSRRNRRISCGFKNK